MRRPGARRERERERGAALLLVVLLIALLSVLVVEFQREAWVEARTSESLRDDLQAHAVLRSGSQLSVQVLAVYSKNSFADMKLALEKMTEAKILWDLFFSDDWVSFPVPAGADEAFVPMSARMVDLCGKFPVGAIEANPQTAVVRLQAFKEYVTALKEYLSDRGNVALEALQPDEFAQAVSEQLKSAGDPKKPLRDLSDLQEVDGVTPEMVAALSPYLDTRVDWKFSVNGLTVPMIMTMLGKSVEEAQEIRGNLQETPLDNANQIASSPLSARNATLYPPASLITKSEGFELFLEADVRGVLRRTRAVYRKDANSPQGRFKADGWVEGWVTGWPAKTETAPKPSPSPESDRSEGADRFDL
ncbi:MAG: general secretion pathway protein GspK [Deltaproteobacteria bacterium]|nr:general secretion pathway protein GspK [Deltaproteobacteria bacterium]